LNDPLGIQVKRLDLQSQQSDPVKGLQKFHLEMPEEGRPVQDILSPMIIQIFPFFPTKIWQKILNFSG
jgi:hypothetical protein